MAADVETMAYSAAGGVPWHGMGTSVENAQSSEEMIVAAGLDWEVGVEKLFGGPSKGKATEYEDWKAIVRKSDGYPLGVCLGRFTPVQNREVFGFMDSLLEDGVLTYETAGALKGGRRVFMLARLQGLGASIAGDTYESYLLGVNGHDNLLSLRVFPTFVRVVCANTLQAALDERGRNMHGGIMLRHVGNMGDKLQQAKAVLRITTESQRRMAKWLEIASETKAPDKKVADVQVAIFGSQDEATPAQRKRALEQFMAIYTEETERVGETAYAIINAVTGYADHAMKARTKEGDEPTKGAEARFNSVLLDTGTSHVFKAKGLHVVETVFGLPALSDIKLPASEKATEKALAAIA